jgi:tetratricopeptide (TPR) repeat protein
LKIILFISALLILFSGCSSVYADKVGANRETSEKRGVSENSEIFFLLLAMDLETKELFSDSAEVFNSLYKDGAGDRYSVEYLRSLNNSGQFVKVIEEAYLLNLNEDDHIREVAKALFALRDYENSISTLKSINLLKEIDYRFLAEACFKSGKFNEAVEYLQDAYRLEPSKDLMLSLAKVLYIYFGKSEEAIANLREHERIHGYDEDISSYLAKIYVESSKFNEATKIYRELYNKTSKDDYAISLVDIFSKTSNTDGLIEFLEESRFNNELLLRLYMAKKKI